MSNPNLDGTTGNPWWWNYILGLFSSFKYNYCTYIGLWGILFYNDGGEMMDACFNIGLKGAAATYVKLNGKY